MNNGSVYLTKEGFEELVKERENLIGERPIAVGQLKAARELGDLSENGYYKASRAKLSFIDSRLTHLKSIIKNSKIITISSTNTVQIGNTVEIKNGNINHIYKLVSKFEADPMNKKISDMSPLGKALLGRKIGEKVNVITPSGAKEYTIVQITI